MDVTAASPAAQSFAEKFGFPALLVVVLLLGIWYLMRAHRDEREKRDALDVEREKARREERREDRDAHLTSLGKHTEVISQLGASLAPLGASLGRVEQKVDNLDRDFVELKGRVRKFDPSKTDP